MAKGGNSQSREGKRSRLGNSKQRALYKSAKAYKHKDYSHLCQKADRLNNRSSTVAGMGEKR